MIKLSLFMILVLLNWIDYDTTGHVLDQFGSEYEANPVMRYAYELGSGMVGIGLFKIIALTLLAFVWWRISSIVISLILILYTIVVLQNIYYVGVLL